ncbi:hypothetical protein KPL74_08765 [Bacillus sp. NP157]|nr:hypothetical protein KPL74_08765 [Bacillus sp. NP157]
MDINTLQTFLPWISCLTPLAVAAALLWVMLRGKSMYPFWLRLWTLFHRKEPADVDWLAGAMDERRALLKFRVLFGWADTLAQARRMERWARTQGTDLGSVCDCGEFFDRRKLRLRPLPSKGGVVARIIPLFLVVATLTGFGLVAVSTTDAVFSVNANGRLLSVDGTTVRVFGEARWTGLDKAGCAGTDDFGHLGDDRAVACDILGSSRLEQHVRDVVRAQRVVGGLAFFYALLIGVPAWRYGASLRAAFALKRELGRTDEGDGDEAVPSDGDGGGLRMALVTAAGVTA